MCYSEHYGEGTAQQVDSSAGWMECVTMNIMWNVLHSSWTVVQVEWNVLQWTLCFRYCTAGEQCCCSLNGVCCNYHQLRLRNTNTGQLWQMKFSLVWIGRLCIGWFEENLSRLKILDFKQTGINRWILANTRNIQFLENSFTIFRVVTFSRSDRKGKAHNIIYQVLFPDPNQTVAQKMYVAADCFPQTDTVSVTFSVHIYCTNTVQTVQSATELYLQ